MLMAFKYCDIKKNWLKIIKRKSKSKHWYENNSMKTNKNYHTDTSRKEVTIQTKTTSVTKKGEHSVRSPTHASVMSGLCTTNKYWSLSVLLCVSDMMKAENLPLRTQGPLDTCRSSSTWQACVWLHVWWHSWPILPQVIPTYSTAVIHAYWSTPKYTNTDGLWYTLVEKASAS